MSYSCCDFARPMLLLMLRATHFATLRDPCRDFARPMLRLCPKHIALRDSCYDFAQLMLRLCKTIIATLRDICCDFAWPILSYVATLCDSSFLRGYGNLGAESPVRRYNSLAAWVADLSPGSIYAIPNKGLQSMRYSRNWNVQGLK